MRLLLDADNNELAAVLEALLCDDVTISVREVSRRHSTLKNVSAFTRNPTRMSLIEIARQRQIDARNVKPACASSKSVSAVQTLAARSAEVGELERQVAALVASHAACVKAVMNTGGLRALERFWTEYQEISNTVRTLGAIPLGAQVKSLTHPQRSQT